MGQWESGKFLPKLPALLELTATYELGSIEELLGGTLGSRELIQLLPYAVDGAGSELDAQFSDQDRLLINKTMLTSD